MKFELFVAARYLRAKRRQAVIGVITAISIVGVAAGVASLIIALAINNGFRQDLQERLLGSTSHVNLMRVENDGISNWRQLQQQVDTTPHVVASAPAIYEQVLISRGARAKGAVLKGVLPDAEQRVSDMLKSVAPSTATSDLRTAEQQGEAKLIAERSPAATQDSANSLPPTSGGNGAPSSANENSSDFAQSRQNLATLPPIILGKDMANELGATVGTVVLVTSPQGELTPFGLVPKYMRFKVVGLFQSGFYDYDSSWAMISLSDAQRLFSLGDIASVIEFKVDDIYKAAQIGDAIEKRAGQGFQTTNWMEQNRALFRALRLERVVTFITISLIVFVAALNILISLIMMVMEKTKDIAVLVSMGTRRSQVRRIFVFQGLLIGVVGTAIGLVLGYGVSLAAGHYHWITLSAEVYAIDYVPFAPRFVDAVLVTIVSLAISFVATIYPSYSAARVLPAEALRYE
ncbi:MAG TPA: FtsX-like permease family protein [Candidatus Acidoferrales bacterium]|nr:FtsX-like permease family protein [Candidatus Acidoferrales bacterium]